MRLKIGSRASDLARIQAYTVGRLLEKQGHEIEYIFRESLGDLNPDIDLSKTFEKGVFTQDFYEALVNGTYDLVVHSWKDLPTEERKGTQVVATLPREDMRDVLLLKKQNFSRLPDLKIFSSSPRRAYNLKKFLGWALPQSCPPVEFVNVRGNVPTRIRKLKDFHDVQGLIVAKAALDRMLGTDFKEFFPVQSQMRQWLHELNWMVLPLEVNPCAAAQGALAIEISSSREDIKKALMAIHDPITWENVNEERKVLKSYGGGCHQKIGVSVLNRSYGKISFLKGLTDSGEVLNDVVLKNSKISQFKNVKETEVFPAPNEELKSFRSEALDFSALELKDKDFWISKATALPENLRIPEDRVVWTAGLKSWKKLAARGVWVHGCAESLGEQEDEAIDTLLGRSPSWVKLTHDRGVDSPGKNTLATYRLKGNFEIPRIEDRKYFYWQSGSQFLQVWEKNKDLLQGSHHACGPGHTYSVLSSVLTTSVSVYLRVEDWWKDLGLKNYSKEV